MKELQLIVEIDGEGQITAEAEGFSGDTCLRELERLLNELAPTTARIERKPDSNTARLARSQKQMLGKKS